MVWFHCVASAHTSVSAGVDNPQESSHLGEEALDHLFCNHFSRKIRKVVREIWFEKNGSRKMVDQKKKSEFAEPLF